MLNPSKKWTKDERETLVKYLQAEIMDLVCEKLPNSGRNLVLKMKILDRLEDCGRRICFLNNMPTTFLETNRASILNGKAPSVSE